MTAVTSADTPMPRRLTLQEWDVEWAARDDAYELVDGIPTVAPAQTYGNREAAFLLAKALWPPLHHDYAVVTDAGVHVGIRDGQHTVRQPGDYRQVSGGRSVQVPVGDHSIGIGIAVTDLVAK